MNIDQNDSVGIAAAVLLGLDPGSFITKRVEAVQAAPGGFVGDRHFGLTHPADSRTSFYPRGTSIFNDRQVTIVSVDELSEIAVRLELPEIKPEWLGANVLVSGIPHFSRLSPGTRLLLSGGASLYLTHSNNPCKGPGDVLQGLFPEREGLSAAFVRQAMHLRGVVAVVDLAGEIRTGETIRVLPNLRYAYLD